MDDRLEIEKKTYNNGQQELKEHLRSLKNWGISEMDLMSTKEFRARVETRRKEHKQLLLEYQLQENEHILLTVQNELPQIKVKETAQGGPVQTQVPADKTYKQKRERKRLEKEAKNTNRLADATSVDMVEELQSASKRREKSYQALPKKLKKEAENKGIDLEVMKIYAQGYDTDWKGTPASMLDKQKMKADTKYMEDWISGDLERRRPHLDRIVEQVLSLNVTLDMLQPEYIQHHAAEVYQTVKQMLYLRKLMRDDAINFDYYNQLPVATKGLIEQRIYNLAPYYNTLMENAFSLKAVDANNAKFERFSNDMSTDRILEVNQTYLSHAQDAIVDAQKEEKDLLAREAESRIGVEQLSLMNAQKKAAAKMPENTDNVKYFKEITRIDAMIEGNREVYEQQQLWIDEIYRSMYQCLDILDDFNMREQAAKIVANNFTENATDRAVKIEFQKKQQQITAEIDFLTKRIQTHTDAIAALLQGKKLSEKAKNLMDQLEIDMDEFEDESEDDSEEMD